jgi:O-antigen biosynthesis protein
MRNRFSLLLAVVDADEDALLRTIGSVLMQEYPDVELCVHIASDIGTEIRKTVAETAAHDRRLRVLFDTVNGDAVTSANAALEHASGDFVGLLDVGDELAAGALGVINHYLASGEDGIDFLYTDHGPTASDGSYQEDTFKPGWSPERLRSFFYCEKLSLFRRTAVVALGGFRSECEGAHVFDLALRVTEQARSVLHIPEVLCRVTDITPTHAAGRRAIQDQCARLGIDARVVDLPTSGTYRVSRVIQGEPLVSVVIPTGGTSRRVWGRERVLVVDAVASILDNCSYTKLEFVIVADATTSPSTITDLIDIGGGRLKVLPFNEGFNFSKKCNVGVAHSTGEYVLLLNDDVEVVSPDFVETMLGQAQSDGVGMVGAKLLFSDGTIQHAGHFYGDSRPHHAMHFYPADYAGPGNMLLIDRECAGVTAACAMLPKDVWDAVGGLTELLPNNYNDVDLSLKIRHLGHRIIWTPHAVLYHFESMSRVNVVSNEEMHFVQVRWDHDLRVDPYGNPNLEPANPGWIPRVI